MNLDPGILLLFNLFLGKLEKNIYIFCCNILFQPPPSIILFLVLCHLVFSSSIFVYHGPLLSYVHKMLIKKKGICFSHSGF